jgi:acylphosphatase
LPPANATSSFFQEVVMEANMRAHVIISGRVQGVFYRLETQRAAQARGVTGWVKNRADGTVEAVFEGRKSRVADMVKWCWEGSPGARVSNVAVVEEAHTGGFQEFGVTY